MLYITRVGTLKEGVEKAKLEEKFIRIFIGSWNVNYVMPDKSLDISFWINIIDGIP